MAPRSALVDRRLLAQLGITDHAVLRFAQRAGLPTARRGAIEPLMRDLLAQEGRIVTTQPRWARSRNEADYYLQVGEWMLFLCRASRRRLGNLDVVTVIASREAATWALACERGLVGTPPPFDRQRPRRRRVRWREVLAAARAAREPSVASARPARRPGRLRALLAARAELHAARDAEHAAALAVYDEARRAHAARRERAHAAHVRRHG
jgi:hypothetical protein